VIKGIIKMIIVALIFLGLLWLGGYSFSSFQHSIDLKNPGEVYEPLIDELPDLPNVDVPDLPDVEDPLVSNDDNNSEVASDTDTNLPNVDIPDISDYPTELEPVDVNLPQAGKGELSEIELSTTRNIKLTINGQSIELTSTTTAKFVKWLATNYNEDEEVEFEELAPIDEETSSEETKKQIEYETVLTSKEDLDTIVATITTVEKLEELDGYDRNEYEKPVQSYELNGETYNRNDYSWKNSEFLISEEPFEYICPYTGETITDESKLDFDHIVPLKSTYLRGADKWTQEQKNEYAYDQSIGIDVLNSANRSKSDKGPTEWLPTENIEDYCYSWIYICSKYNLVMTEEELEICMDEINTALNNGETIQLLGIVNIQ